MNYEKWIIKSSINLCFCWMIKQWRKIVLKKLISTQEHPTLHGGRLVLSRCYKCLHLDSREICSEIPFLSCAITHLTPLNIVRRGLLGKLDITTNMPITLGDKILTDDHTHCMTVSTRIKRIYYKSPHLNVIYRRHIKHCMMSITVFNERCVKTKIVFRAY